LTYSSLLSLFAGEQHPAKGKKEHQPDKKPKKRMEKIAKYFTVFLVNSYCKNSLVWKN